MDESRCIAQQQVPFANGASHEAESIVPEKPKAPVGEARGLAARPAREIAPIDQRGGEAAAPRVPRDAGADDSPSDDENIERLTPHPLDVRLARPRLERGHVLPGQRDA